MVSKKCYIFAACKYLHGANILKIMHQNDNFKQNFIKMVFSEYMRSLPTPRNKIVNEIAERCKVTKFTVYRWAADKAKPNPLCRSLIADVLNMEEGELFPDCAYGTSGVL